MNASFSPTQKLVLVSLIFAAAIGAAKSDSIPEECKVGDFFVGCQAYTFNRFSVFEAIEKTAQAGGTVIEFYPGQKLSPAEPNIAWDHNASDEVIQKVKGQLEKFHVRAVGYGVVGAQAGSEADWRKVFEFAKKMGLYSITTESVGDLDIIEKLVKEYDLKVGIHEHRRQPASPGYKVWDPNYVLSVVKDRDPRIGACADTGHWATSGLTPLDGIKLLHGRVISLHLKERKQIGKEMPDSPYGTGASDIKGILAELKQQHFDGQIAIEYEGNWENNVPDVAQCIGFVRGYSAAATPLAIIDKTHPVGAPLVYFEITGPNGPELKQFYATIFDWKIDERSTISAASTGGLKGGIRADPAEKIFYLGVPDIGDALKRIEASGGKTVVPRTVVPGVVTFALFLDPAGNRMGLAELGSYEK